MLCQIMPHPVESGWATRETADKAQDKADQPMWTMLVNPAPITLQMDTSIKHRESLAGDPGPSIHTTSGRVNVSDPLKRLRLIRRRCSIGLCQIFLQVDFLVWLVPIREAAYHILRHFIASY